MNNNENINQVQNDEIDLKEIFKTIFRYKYSILVITLFIYMVMFKDALLIHGPKIFFANIPGPIIGNYFLNLEHLCRRKMT